MSVPTLSVQTNGGPGVSGDNLNTYQQTCDNMAQLRAFTGISGIQVYARGTSAIGDGGQGVFYWNVMGTAVDDNGATTVVPSGATSGEWTRLGGSGTTQASLTVTGNATIGGTLTVTGATSLTSATVSGNAAVAGNETVGGTLSVVGVLTAPKFPASNLGSQGLQTTFTAVGSNTFTTPATSSTSTVYRFRMIGAGGGGGGVGGSSSAAAGGGAGAYAEGTFTGIASSTGITVTIGAAGISGSSSGGAGGAGGNTSLASPVSITCTGGSGGAGGVTSNTALGGAGGTVSIGSPSIQISGQNGGSAISTTTFAISGGGGCTLLGSGGQPSVNFTTLQSASSPLGYGGGGAGVTGTNVPGVAGAQGFVIIEQLTP